MLALRFRSVAEYANLCVALRLALAPPLLLARISSHVRLALSLLLIVSHLCCSHARLVTSSLTLLAFAKDFR